jgi:hypothetical protein
VAYSAIRDQRLVAKEAGREDIRGQIVAYGAAFGSIALDVENGLLTSPYTTPLVQTLREDKDLIGAIIDAHQHVLDASNGQQRPLLSTSMNGQIYLHRQPATRRKRVLAISEDNLVGGGRLQGPPNDVEAITAALIEAGFYKSDVLVLQNPDRTEIERAINDTAQIFSQHSNVEVRWQLPLFGALPITRVGFAKVVTAPNNTLFLLYYSGQGFNADGVDYITTRPPPGPTDQIGRKDIENTAISLNWLKEKLESSAAASVIILDTNFVTASFPTVR